MRQRAGTLSLSLSLSLLSRSLSLSDEERSGMVVTHITGPRDQASISTRYERLRLIHEVHPFFRAMDELFSNADLAITRAGANTLFELAAFGIPAFVIPYPHAGGHQKYNAQSFAEKGGLIFHEEGPEAKGWLVEHLRNAIEDPGSLAGIAKAIQGLARPKATDELIEIAQCFRYFQRVQPSKKIHWTENVHGVIHLFFNKKFGGSHR